MGDDPKRSAEPVGTAPWRYTLHAEIARGGMGRVVEATDNVLGRTVALKEALSADGEALRRFQRETQITARLEHPSIVPIHDAGTSPNGSPFYVMRKISGRPLEELVARSESLNARLALVPHVVAAAHAVAHAHARGIVHRDIKPSNIVVGDAGQTIVIDWGLAKPIGEADDSHAPVQRVTATDDSVKTRAGVVFGTPGFMAPEQLRTSNGIVDARCDVYALGATLYHLLARRPPHYSKDADQMMHAAVEGPPRPIRELVSGVPPELATIVDKALAHDASRRYHDAGALAEDLQRFLTGQLVASHYYTPRERLVRFVRKHRAAVSIALGSLIVLGVVAFILVQQIRGERDRADAQAQIAVHQQRVAEQQREKAIHNSRELTLGNARHATFTDPTRAVALVKPLVDSDLWRHARDVGAAASMHGVAFGLRASHHIETLELSRDGQRALAAGDDGVVRIYDLAKRDSRVIIDMKDAVNARFADGERKLVLFQGNRLTVMDIASGTRRDVTAPTAIAKLEVSGPIAFWVDPHDALWKLDLAGIAPARVDLSEPVVDVSPSPDGRWIALAGRQHVLLVDRSRSASPAEIITEGKAKDIAWAADGSHMVALTEKEIVDVAMQPAPNIINRLLVGNRFSIAYSAGRIFSAGPEGVEMMLKDGNRMRAAGPQLTLGVFEGRDRTVISAKPQGEIIVLSDFGDLVLASPQPLDSVAASASGPWIVGATTDRLLVWNLDALEPELVASEPSSSARFVTGTQLIITYADSTADWIDLRTHKKTELGRLQAIAWIAASPDETEAIIIDGQRHALRVAGVGQPRELDGEVSAAAFVDNARAVIATTGGLRLEGAQQPTKLPLFAHQAEARGLAATPAEGGWVVAAFADGVVWRKNLGSSVVGKLEVPPPSGRIPLFVLPNGTALIGLGGELRVWRPDGQTETLTKQLPAISALELADANNALVLCEDGSVHVIDLLRALPLAAPAANVGRSASLAREQGLIAASSSVGGVEVIDALTSWRWPLASPQKGQPPYSFVEIAPDGSRVVAVTPSSVLVWTLALPRSSEQTKRWLDTLTNATADTPSGPLEWH